ncbi:hypothetical protein ES707_01921 [subsurface metagenome]
MFAFTPAPISGRQAHLPGPETPGSAFASFWWRSPAIPRPFNTVGEGKCDFVDMRAKYTKLNTQNRNPL